MSKIREYIADLNPDLVLMDGYDGCICGIGTRVGGEQFVAYDYAKVIAQNMSAGMTVEEAAEYFHYKQECAYVGEHTPAFIVLIHEIATDTAPSREGQQASSRRQANL